MIPDWFSMKVLFVTSLYVLVYVRQILQSKLMYVTRHISHDSMYTAPFTYGSSIYSSRTFLSWKYANSFFTELLPMLNGVQEASLV